MVEIKPGEAIELSLQKNIEKLVRTKTTTTDNGISTEIDSCKKWKSRDMMNCIQNLVRPNLTNLECRLPMTLIQGKQTLLKDHKFQMKKLLC